MNSNLTKARELLAGGSYTCVLCLGDTTHTATERGVRPLLDWLDSDTDLRGFSAADKVVGKAAAMLYVLLGVKEVYAPVMSEGAVRTLRANSIRPTCDITANVIINRAGDGSCPMEQTVSEIDDPTAALAAIRAKLAQLSA